MNVERIAEYAQAGRGILLSYSHQCINRVNCRYAVARRNLEYDKKEIHKLKLQFVTGNLHAYRFYS